MFRCGFGGGQSFQYITGRSRDNCFRDGSQRLTSRAALASEASAKTGEIISNKRSRNIEDFPSR
jgi:hypothetical protein